MIKVHHLENSRSQRVLWLLEELGLPYELVRYARDKATLLAPPELKRVHPLGKSPVIEDGGEVIAETGAIVEYLVDGPGGGRLKPAPGTPDARRYTYWLHYAEGSAMPPLLLKLVFQMLPARAPMLLKPLVKTIAASVQTGFVDPQTKLHMDWWERSLSEQPWFAGSGFTAADIQMSFPMEAASARAGLLHGRPRCGAFIERIHARPAYQRALERGGPYAYAD